MYRAAAAALAPLAAWRLARLARADDGLAARQVERHGIVPEARDELWIHAASVGEVHAAAPLVQALQARHAGVPLLLTTFTASGAQAVARLHSERSSLRHLFVPLDTPHRVRRWLDQTRPAGLILVETELWPELLIQCRQRHIPVAMVSARLAETSRRRLQRGGSLVRDMLHDVSPILCQSAADRDRFMALGVRNEQLALTGNLKFDAGTEVDAVAAAVVDGWQSRWSGRPTWVAGSSHCAEEPLLAQAQRTLRKHFNDVLMVLVPRHPERAGEALATLQQHGLQACRIDQFDGSIEIAAVVVDRLGVLAQLYAETDLSVVCGSFAPGVGGHNLLEPARAGRPVLSGRWTESQRALADGLRAAGALIELDDAESLAAALAKLFINPDQARQRGEAARAWAQTQFGAVARTMDELEPWLEAMLHTRNARSAVDPVT